MRGERAGGNDIDIVYCRDREITALNREFKGRNETTDVLAFNLSDGGSDNYLGEIYVNLQMARRQARLFRVSYSQEVKRLTIHGVLHLLGFRDDTKASRARMWACQENYLGNGGNGR
ncbi:MAG: rRNA maturation RNase YbeY [candidate division Zixibacteria bacterium RBG_16_53_22]|nr:MAG: rRNA maturation RNase YbeY [candidate division Zixibacteria bacterium RBG_16_53_22]